MGHPLPPPLPFLMARPLVEHYFFCGFLTGEGKFGCHWYKEQIIFEMDRLSSNENENKASSVTLLTAKLTFHKYATVRKT